MPGPMTKPSPLDPTDASTAIARFTVSVGDTESSRVDLRWYMLRHLRFPSSGVTATSFKIGVATSESDTLFPVRDVLEASDYTVQVAAGKQVAISFTVGLGAQPIVALIGDAAQATSAVTIDAILVEL